MGSPISLGVANLEDFEEKALDSAHRPNRMSGTNTWMTLSRSYSLPEKDLHITGSDPVMLNFLLDQASYNWTGLTFTRKNKTNHTGHSVQ